MTTSLARRLARQIRLNGPISVAEFMSACLFDPEHGYYTTREPFGRDGDFITAPEISQIFGELVAIWLVEAWRRSGAPAPFVLAEIGPGRGTLAADVMRTLKRVAPDMLAAARFHLVEASPRLVEIQRRTLAGDADSVAWTDRLESLPMLPLLIIGNEIFDALPMRQYLLTASGWRERLIALDPQGRLAFLAGPGTLDRGLLPAGEPGPGAIFEVAPAREAMAATIAAHIAAHGGAGLFFDYGHLEPGYGDTLQALRSHGFADVFACPGEADLTSHVDFAALAAAAARENAGAALLEQGAFLTRMGLFARAEALSAARPDQAAAITQAARRLAGDDAMGKLFKVMTIHKGASPPFPFDGPAHAADADQLH